VSENVTLFAAFVAGFLSFISPCVLPLIPGYISFVSGA
jgi:cytochrome c-type biogenesis protein